MQKIILNTPKYCHLIDEEEIVYAQITDGVTNIFLTGKPVLKIRYPLSGIIKQASANNLIYTNRFAIVNTKHIVSIHKKPSLHLMLSNQHEVMVSESKQSDVISMIERNNRILM